MKCLITVGNSVFKGFFPPRACEAWRTYDCPVKRIFFFNNSGALYRVDRDVTPSRTQPHLLIKFVLFTSQKVRFYAHLWNQRVEKVWSLPITRT